MNGNQEHGPVNQTVRAGRDASGITQVAGTDNTVGGGKPGASELDQVRQAVHEMQVLMANQPAPKALADAMAQGVATAAPKKEDVGEQLKVALDVAKTGLGWAELSVKLAPSVRTLAQWLGGEWASFHL